MCCVAVLGVVLQLLSLSCGAVAQETEIFYEVEGKWVVVGDVQVDIGANASAGV